MDYESWPSLPAMFFDQAAERTSRPFLWAKRDDRYQPLTWGEVAETIRVLSRGLRALGVQRGDRVVLVSENRPEWLIADLAIMAAGAITVPAYTTNTPSDHNYILNHCGACCAIVSTKALARKLLAGAVKAPECRFVVAIEDLAREQTGPVVTHSWQSVLAAGRELADDVDRQIAEIKRDDVACFIYTSGTGGAPKGVMLSHRAIFTNCMGAYHLLKEIGLGNEIFLSFLPLSHSYEHTAGQFFPISIGAQIYYAEGVESLLTNLAEARPTIMTAVPRLYEAMHQKILRAMEKQSATKQRLFRLAERLGRKRYHDPKSLTFGERLLDLLAELLVRRKMRKRFGGRLKAMVSGGAALNPDIGIFFTALGLRVLQGYGQTEAAPVIAANPPRKVKMETVGPPLRGVEVKIAEDGEILVRGDMVMNGYWQDEETTRQTLRDGWLHTGDVGEIDGDGYIRITDRKKDIIVLSGGDNISPTRVEGYLTLQPEIAQAMVYGDKHPNLVAILVPDQEFLEQYAGERKGHVQLAALCGEPALQKALGAVVERVNRELSPLEKVRRFVIAESPFTVENEMMTPTLKIRRHVVKKVYGQRLEALYERG